MAEEESAEHYLQVMAGNARQLWQWLRQAEQRVRQGFNNQQRRRVMIEGGNSQPRWNADLDGHMQGIDPRKRTQLLERQADAQLREARTLEEGNRDLEIERRSLQQQVDASAQRLGDQEAALNDARDRNAAEREVDADDNNKPDWKDREDEAVQQNEEEELADEAQEDRDEQAREDEAKRKQQEEDRRRDQQREGGVDAADAVPAAVGAAEAAEALDDELNEDRAADLGEQEDLGADGQQQDQQDLAADDQQQDPATEAENQQPAETDVAEQPGLDADDSHLQQDDLQQQEQQALGAEGQQAEEPGAEQAALDTDNTGIQQGYPQQNGQVLDEDVAVRDQTLGAEGQQQDEPAAGQDQQLAGQEPEVAAPEPEQVQGAEQQQQQVQASEQGLGEQNADQAGQQLNAQQVGNAAQSGVDQSASLGSDEQGQSQGGQESQGPQPPVEKVLAAQREEGGPNRPGSEIPPGERDTLTRTQQGHAPAAGATSREGGGVATSERPGTPAQQRGQDRNRGDRGRDDGGRER